MWLMAMAITDFGVFGSVLRQQVIRSKIKIIYDWIWMTIKKRSNLNICCLIWIGFWMFKSQQVIFLLI